MSQHAYGLKKTVLIETSWNVKNYQLSFRNRLASINRNIVECKEAYGLAKGIQRIVLIETSWNVKPEVFPSTVAEPVFLPLHSTMFLLIRYAKQNLRRSSTTLHSTMFLLIPSLSRLTA